MKEFLAIDSDCQGSTGKSRKIYILNLDWGRVMLDHFARRWLLCTTMAFSSIRSKSNTTKANEEQIGRNNKWQTRLFDSGQMICLRRSPTRGRLSRSMDGSSTFFVMPCVSTATYFSRNNAQKIEWINNPRENYMQFWQTSAPWSPDTFSSLTVLSFWAQRSFAFQNSSEYTSGISTLFIREKLKRRGDYSLCSSRV